jgi:hypothetical protein
MSKDVTYKVLSHFFTEYGKALDSLEYDRVMVRGYITSKLYLYRIRKKLQYYIRILRKNNNNSPRINADIRSHFKRLWKRYRHLLSKYYEIANRKQNKMKLIDYAKND